MPLDYNWYPGIIEGSGHVEASLPSRKGIPPQVVSDRDRCFLTLLHVRANTTLLLLHRPYANTATCDVAAIDASHNIVMCLKQLHELSHKSDIHVLRQRTIWTVVGQALQVFAYQATLYDNEPDMVGVRRNMEVMRKIIEVEKQDVFSPVANFGLERLIDYIEAYVDHWTNNSYFS